MKVFEPPVVLGELSVGDRARVCGITGQHGLRHRLMELGLVSATEVEVVRKAPLGDPMELRLRGYHLSIRSEDAQAVCVERLPRVGQQLGIMTHLRQILAHAVNAWR